MRFAARLPKLLLAALAIAAGTPALAADYGDGLRAFRQRDYDAAAAIMMPLAKSGDPYAQFALGVMYDDGLGLPQSFDRALDCYLLAAKGGLVDAQYMAGKYYATGRGRKQDIVRALVWLDLAASGGYPKGEIARDTARDQLSEAKVAEAQEVAVDWLAQNPQRLTCKMRGCIHASWLPRPKWTVPDTEF